MYRYRDSSGLTRTLADDAELRAAIADGRIGAGTPIADEGGRWTVARLHPACADALREGRATGAAAGRATRPPAGGAQRGPRTPFWQLRGMGLVRDPRGIALIVVLSILIVWAGEGSPWPGSGDDERAALAASFTAASAGDETARAALATPPEDASLRPAWATLAAWLDLQDAIREVGEELGYTGALPAGFMSDDHVRNPSSYYHVPVYLEMLDTYHARCSSILANGRDSAVRRRAVEAGLSPSETQALIDRLENTFLAFQGHHDAARRAAIRASAVHRHLLGYEGRVNPGPNGVEFRDRAAQAEYDRILAQLAQDQETLARLDQERRDALQAVLGDLGL